MTIRFAERLSRLGTESAFEVLAHARLLEAEGQSIVHLEIGEPDFATPDNIIDAAVRAMRDGATHYTAASGIREVREKTAAYVTRHTGVPAAIGGNASAEWVSLALRATSCVATHAVSRLTNNRAERRVTAHRRGRLRQTRRHRN